MKSIELDGKVRGLTVKKYTLLLKSALIKIQKYENFSSVDFAKENKVAVNFIDFMYKLRFIDKVKNGAKSSLYINFDPNKVTENEGYKIAQLSLGYNLINLQHLDKSEAHRSFRELVDDLNFSDFVYGGKSVSQFKNCHKEEEKLGFFNPKAGGSIEEVLKDVGFPVLKPLPSEVVVPTQYEPRCNLNITMFTDEELFNELKNRGYEGELNKIKTLK